MGVYSAVRVEALNIILVFSIPVAERSNARFCGRSLAGIAGSNLAGRVDMSRVNVACYQVEDLATSRSVVQRSPTDCGVSLCVIQNRQ